MGPVELLIIAAVILVLFGASKLPQLGKGLGRGIKEFKEETREVSHPGPDAQPLNPELRTGTQREVVDVVSTELPRDGRSVVTTEVRERQG
ncbi:twin-arginine translocase TatA/TatE family subunit [Deinococcus radiophilus]|uniref:Sec-independent protein translocase protein TatA n=1 Tax=Deinococcus radiophilus TaxID=32062 RepID=A0A3S0KFL2_9DEIO|nr:twin-arginine translocase TatA/TatE family subunit [Deinococcus radiophilus]RTR29439.1 twin-arginine translocase TatA/TatE family subunit [Deinococcus radiophilus]UFA50728.1 twin-arginine translocase TatA/TatE family subunit [Deinococcus radiophilus]